MKRIVRFLRATDGNYAMLLGILMMPLAVAVGLVVDYSRSSTVRSNMQNALDAASLGALSMSGGEARDKALDEIYAANLGIGDAQIVGDLEETEAGVVMTTRADAEVPTTFMRLTGVDKTDITVWTKVAVKMKLTQIAFNFKKASGWWDKEVSLMGRGPGDSGYTKLASIHYRWNGKTGGNAVGDTDVQMLRNGAMTKVLSQRCPGAAAQSCKITFTNGEPKVDVSKMNELYLRMEISTPIYEDAKKDIKRTPLCRWISGLTTQNSPIGYLLTGSASLAARLSTYTASSAAGR